MLIQQPGIGWRVRAHAAVIMCRGASMIALLFSVWGVPVFAQTTTMPAMDHGAMAKLPSDSTKGMASMPPDPLGVPMDRAASGTTWIPDAIQLPTKHFPIGSWDVMVHGFVFVQFDKQGGPRGDQQFGSLNWGMLMAGHELAGGRFQARLMLSVDPATVSARGYPLLLQSGESYNGVALHDRQHPHDFFTEVSVSYERALTRRVGLSLYAAPSGEPALSPVAFMHRPSAMDNPSTPLGHHWQDATHVAFGVLTAGVFTTQLKLEGSVFNGREPDQYRWDFDRLALDSYSARATLNPNSHWSLTGGYGYLKSPEELHPTDSEHRITASVMNGFAIGSEGQVATSFVYGANKHADNPEQSSSVLLESEAILDAKNTVFGRFESIQKSDEDLAIDVLMSGAPASGANGTRLYQVNSVSLGYVRELHRVRGATLGLGVVGTMNVVPTSLQTEYGSRTPVGGMIFVRLRAALSRERMRMKMPMNMPGMR